MPPGSRALRATRCGSARSGRGSLDGLPAHSRTRAHPCARPYRAFPACPRRGRRGPGSRATARAKAALLCLLLLRAGRARSGSSRGTHGLAATAGDQAPQGSARGIAPIPLLHRMCNQRNPTADADPTRAMRVGRKALGRVSLVPFFARAKKGTRSPKASGSSCSKKTKTARTGFPPARE